MDTSGRLATSTRITEFKSVRDFLGFIKMVKKLKMIKQKTSFPTELLFFSRQPVFADADSGRDQEARRGRRRRCAGKSRNFFQRHIY